MSSTNPLYAVCYIDKFADPIQSKNVTHSMVERFSLSPNQGLHLCSGKPLVVKQGVALDLAERLRRMITQLGGTCWIQNLPSDGNYRERRQLSRRVNRDRRSLPRTNIVPDRRDYRDRRQVAVF